MSMAKGEVAELRARLEASRILLTEFSTALNRIATFEKNTTFQQDDFLSRSGEMMRIAREVLAKPKSA